MKFRFGIVALAAMLLLGLSACSNPTSGSTTNNGGSTANNGDTTSNGTIISQTVQGKIDGAAFTMASGYAENLNGDSTKYSIYLYDIAQTAGAQPWSLGAYPFSGYLKVMFNVPKTPGTYPLHFSLGASQNQTVTLFDPATYNNTACASGQIRIDSVTTDPTTQAITLNGGVVATADSNNTVNGTFSIPVKP